MYNTREIKKKENKRTDSCSSNPADSLSRPSCPYSDLTKSHYGTTMTQSNNYETGS